MAATGQNSLAANFRARLYIKEKGEGKEIEASIIGLPPSAYR